MAFGNICSRKRNGMATGCRGGRESVRAVCEVQNAEGQEREQRPPKRFGVLLSLFLIWICVCQNVNKHGRGERRTDGQTDGRTMVLTFILLFIFSTYVYTNT